MTEIQSEREAAKVLTEFLTRKTSYSTSAPIEGYIQTEIANLAKKIAREVVAGNGQLAETIRNHAKEVVYRALREDTYLNSMITKAISGVITDIALNRSDEDS